MLLEGHNNKRFYLGSYATKTYSFGAEIGTSSLNVESNDFITAQTSLVIHRSNDAAPERNLAQEVKEL